jgi:hypothetical protein
VHRGRNWEIKEPAVSVFTWQVDILGYRDGDCEDYGSMEFGDL